MNVYKYLKIAASGSIPDPIKLFGLWLLHVTGRRLIGIFIDPVMACNLRCKMCYFSDPVKRSEMKGMMTAEQLEFVAKSLMPRAAKLQIGCGAEPTLYPQLVKLVEMGKSAGIPYVSITSNGKLLAERTPLLHELVDAGLSELTLSLHGTRREIYESLMPGANFDLLKKLAEIIAEVKQKHADFKFRVNYTINSLNVDDLTCNLFWDLWQPGGEPDIVQLRPVQKIGDSEWNDFSLDLLKEKYDSTIGALAKECESRKITCIAPSLEQIDEVATDQSGISSIINDITYCYVGPQSCYKSDFSNDDTYESYHKRNKTAKMLLKAIVWPKNAARKRNVSKKLNYTVK